MSLNMVILNTHFSLGIYDNIVPTDIGMKIFQSTLIHSSTSLFSNIHLSLHQMSPIFFHNSMNKGSYNDQVILIIKLFHLK